MPERATVRQRGERGQILPLVAICLAVLMGFAGLAVDMGYLQYEERQQQTATDSAAIAAATELAQQGYQTSCPSGDLTAIAFARSDAAKNGYTDGAGSVTVTEQNPPPAVGSDPYDTGYYSSVACAVEVDITAPYPAFFLQLFGYNHMWKTTRAVAEVSAGGNSPCFVALNPSGSPSVISSLNAGTIDAPNCGIFTDGKFCMSGNTTGVAGEIGYMSSPSGATGCNNNLVTPAPQLMSYPALDPCSSIPDCYNLQHFAPITTTCISPIPKPDPGTYTLSPTYTAGLTELQPNPYCGADFKSDIVTFEPGLYVFTSDIQGSGGPTFTSAAGGVTFYFESGGFKNFNQAATLDLCASGYDYNAQANVCNIDPPLGQCSGSDGVLFYDPTDSGNINFNNTADVFGGIMYFPNGNVTINSSLNDFVSLISATFTINGAGIDINTAGPCEATSHVALVE
jgi:hypothetical protein